MRTIWKGTISFGLVSIPVRVVGATESHAVSFRQIHTSDEGRIRYRKVCELEDTEVPSGEIGRAYETADGTLVQVTDADLAALPLPTARTVDILGFVPLHSIDPYQFDRSYYLTAEGSSAAKPYTLLREALRRAEKGAVAKLAMRGRETLALVRTLEGEDVLGMHTLLWPDEIRSAEGLAPSEHVTVREAELDLADTLMDTLGTVDMAGLRDEYRAAVQELVDTKLAGLEPAAPAERPPGGRVIDLMSALEDSVRSARQARGEAEPEDTGEGASVTPLQEPRTPRRKAAGAAGRKGTAGATGKATGKKATARKTAAGKAGKKTAGRAAGTKGTAQRAGGEAQAEQRDQQKKQAPRKKAASRKRAS